MNENIKSVAYGNGVYIAAAGDRILKSTDGENWTLARMTNQTSILNQLTDVAFGDGTFIVCGQCYYYVTQDNGATWTEGGHASNMEHVAFGDGTFILASPEAGGIISIDSCTLKRTSFYEVMDEMAFVDGAFYGVRRDSNDQNLYRLTGTTWQSCYKPIPTSSSRCLRSVNGRLLLGAAGNTYEFLKGTNGTYSFLNKLTNISGQMIDACEANGKLYILTKDHLCEETGPVLTAGEYDYICCCNGPDHNIHLFSADSSQTTYSSFDPSEYLGPREFYIQSMVYANGIYMAAAGDQIVTSMDGEHWKLSRMTDLSNNNNRLTKVIYGNGKFVICGQSCYFITSDNGQSWTQRDSASYLDGGAYGDGQFILTSSEHGGTVRLDEGTLIPSWIDAAVTMGDVVFWNGQFYAVKNSTSDKNVYTLAPTGSSWTAHAVAFPNLTKAKKTLRLVNGQILIGYNETTSQLTENFTLQSVGTNSYMIDACSINEMTCILTESGLYNRGTRLQSSTSGTFKCCCTGHDSKIRLIQVTPIDEDRKMTYPNGFNIKSMAYGNGVFIAAAGDRILKSTDGANWKLSRMTTGAFRNSNDLTRVVYGEGKFLVCGQAYIFISGDNGESWTEISSELYYMRSATYGNGNFYLSAPIGRTLKIDANTLESTVINSDQMRNIAYWDGNLFGVKPIPSDQNLYVLSDANTWTVAVSGIPQGDSNRTLLSVNNELFLGNNTSTLKISKDANGTYSAVPTDIASKMLDACEMREQGYILTSSSLYTTDGVAVASCANGSYVACCPDGANKVLMYALEDSKEAFDSYQSLYNIQSIAYGNGIYMAAAGDRILKSTDGRSWTTSFIFDSGNSNTAKKIAYGNGNFFVCGETIYYYMTANNGSSWQQLAFAIPFTDVSFGAGYFLVTSWKGAGTAKIAPDTFTRTILNGVDMGSVAYVNGVFYGVKKDANDAGLYELNASNTWECVSSLIPTGDIDRCLRSVNGRLLLGNLNATYEFAKNESGQYTTLQRLEKIEGKMLDACGSNEKTYILTPYRLYVDGVEAAFTTKGYRCCCADGEKTICLYSCNGAEDALASHNTNPAIVSIAFGDGIYIAAAGDRILRSNDGINWKEVKFAHTVYPQTSNLTKAVYGDGKFLVCGQKYYYITSDGGQTWAERASAALMDSAAYGAGQFILTSSAHACTLRVQADTLEAVWINDQQMGDVVFRKEEFADWNSCFYSVRSDASDHNLYILTPNATVWSSAYCENLPEITLDKKRILSQETFLLNNQLYNLSRNAQGRLALGEPYFTGDVIDICSVGPADYYLTLDILYKNDEEAATATEHYTCCFADSDGIIHLFEGSGDSLTYPETPAIRSMAYGNGVYIGVTSDKIVRSADGISWENAKDISHITVRDETRKVVFGGGKFLVCAANYYFVTSDNGATWTEDDSASVFNSAAYSDNAFYLSTTYGGTSKLDFDTLKITRVADAMGDITYLDGTLYGVKTTASDPYIYYLNSSNVWTILAGSYTLPSSEERCLQGINNRLFLGIGNATYEVSLAPESNYAQLSLLDISGRMIDACTINGRFYLLTESGLYEDESLVCTTPEGHYTCCCAGVDSQVRLVTVNGTKAIYSGYTSVAPTFTIKSMAYGNGVYIAVVEDRILRSADGVSWETVQMTNHYFTLRALYRVVYANGTFVVGGDCVVYASKDNGSSWSTFSSSVPMDSVAYGDGKFMLTSSQYPCIIQLTDTLQKTWIDTALKVQDIVYVNDAFYGIYYKSATENGLYKLNSSNAWTLVLGNLSIGAENCLRAAGGRLFLGSSGRTCEFTKNTDGEYASLALCSAIGEAMVDACQTIDVPTLKDRACILTETMVYDLFENETITVNYYAADQYLCCCTGGDDRVLLSSVSQDENILKKYTKDEMCYDYHIYSVAHANNTYIAAAGKYILRSTESSGWEIVQTLPDTESQLTRAVFGSNMFVVCGGHYYCYSTDNGVTWVQKEVNAFLTGAAYGGGRFIMVGGGTLSLDAATKSQEWIGHYDVCDVAYVDGRFYAVGRDSVFQSLNTSDLWAGWFPLPSTEKGCCLRSVGNRLFVGINDETYELQMNEDGYFTSAKLLTYIYGPMIDACEMNGSVYLLTAKVLHKDGVPVGLPIGDSCTCCCPGSTNKIDIYSFDGFGSTLFVYDRDDTLPDYGIKDIAFADDVYMAAAGSRILKSTDGLRWKINKILPSTAEGTQLTKAIYGNNLFILYGQRHLYYSKDNGGNWTVSTFNVYLTNAILVDNTFTFISSGENSPTGGAFRLNSDTLEFSLVNTEKMYDIAYALGSYYGIRENETILYKLNSDDFWDAIYNFEGIEHAGNCLRGVGNRLFIGANNRTWEFEIREDMSDFSMTNVFLPNDEMVDACALKENTAPLTRSALAANSTDTTAVIGTPGAVYVENQLVDTIPSNNLNKLTLDEDTIHYGISGNSGGWGYSAPKKQFSDGTGSGSNPNHDPSDRSKEKSYSVVTDTHGYPWGSYEADFDLGDNTTSTARKDMSNHKAIEDPRLTNSSLILYGNHDVIQTGQLRGLQSVTYNGIKFFGLDSALPSGSFSLDIEQIQTVIDEMNKPHFNYDIIILTHVPLFPNHSLMGQSYSDYGKWVNSETKESFLTVLNDYNDHQKKAKYQPKTMFGKTYNFTGKTGRVIGCFCGHIHNSIQCYYHNLYMESFDTNGCSQWRDVNKNNGGLYTPITVNKDNQEHYIKVDFVNQKVNGHRYDQAHLETKAALDVVGYKQNNQFSYPEHGKEATGKYTFTAEYESGSNSCYPKFCMNGAGYGVYVGYSGSPNGGVTAINYNNGWWPTQNGYIAELDAYPTYIRFNSAGRLQFYSKNANANGPYEPIPNYNTRNLTLTANNYIWQFVGGRLSYLAPKPTYTSGEIVGGNYKIKFDSQGYATSITTLDGGSVSDSAGNNWINVSEIWVYWKGLYEQNDPKNYKVIKTTPQIGITGQFSSGDGRINMVRETTKGENKITGKKNLLIWVKGTNGKQYWLYDGRLTTLTNKDCGY